jgi:hypothetical protein
MLQFKETFVLLFIIILFTFFSVHLSYSQNASITNTNQMSSADANFNNVSNTGIPLNPDRLQIIIQNGTSESSEQRMVSLYTNIATAGGAAGGAIGGAIAGSVLTARHARKLEERKEAAGQREETKFNGVLESIRIELVYHSEFIDTCIKLFEGSPEDEVKGKIRVARRWADLYTTIPIERRVRFFGPSLTGRLEITYNFIKSFREVVLREFGEYPLERIKEELERRKYLVGWKEKIDILIESIENRLTEIRRSYENTSGK